MRILLVDDEEEFVTALAERLSLRGIEADWAISGSSALAKIEERDYDLVVVDLKMPGISGEEMMKRIEARRPEMKFIVLTGHLEGGCSPEAEAAGRCFHLIKPAEIEELMELIHRAVKT